MFRKLVHFKLINKFICFKLKHLTETEYYPCKKFYFLIKAKKKKSVVFQVPCQKKTGSVGRFYSFFFFFTFFFTISGTEMHFGLCFTKIPKTNEINFMDMSS